MKRTLYILGVISIIIMLLGFIFKVNHLPGAGIALTVAMLLVAFWFFPSALISNYKSGDNKKYKTLYIVAFISIFFTVLGALFKIQRWPGANFLMIIGLPLPFILFLPVYIYHHNKNKLKADKNFFAIMFFMIYVGVISTLLALNVSREVIYAPAISHDSFNDIKEYMVLKNLSVYSDFENNMSDNKQLIDIKDLQLKTNKLSDLIQQTKLDIVLKAAEAKENVNFISQNNEIDLLGIYWKNPKETPSVFRYDPNDKNSRVFQLQKSIEEYENFVNSVQRSYKNDDKMVSSLFNLIEIEKPPYDEKCVGQLRFHDYTGFNAVANLSGMQSTIRLIENEILELISKNVPN